MPDHLDQHRRYLVGILYSYAQALESGNLETIAGVMRQAEQNPILERMLLEMSEVYQAADSPFISPDELAHIQDFLTPLLEQEATLKVYGSGPKVEQKPVLPPWQQDTQERKQEIMKDSVHTVNTKEQPQFQDESHGLAYHPVRKRRLSHFMQMLAAVLVVGVLLAGFLLLLGSRHPITSGPSTGPAASGSSVIALSSSDGTVFALRPRDGAVLWHYATGIDDPTLGSDSSLAVLNHVVYFVARGRVFAFGDGTGKMLWHQDVLPASAHVFGSTTYNFALDGDVLLVRLANNGGETSVLFALQATTGSILWHYEMNWHYLMTASHGIVYVGTTDATGGNPMLRALRIADGKELWSYRGTHPPLPITILVVDKVLYMQADVFEAPISNKAQIYQSLTALNALTGALIWSRPIQTVELEVSNDMGLMLSENGAPVLYNGYQFCAYRSSDGAQLWCSHDFAPRQTNAAALISNFYTSADQTLATLRISSGKNSLFLKLEALNLRTGKTLWSRDLAISRASGGMSEGEIGALIRGDSSTVYAVAGDDTYAFTSSNGHVLWHTRSGAAGITGLAVG